MLYNIDGKYYILASRKYKEVTINKDKNNGYDVKVVENAKPIEYSSDLKIKETTVEQAYRNKRNNFNKIDE